MGKSTTCNIWLIYSVRTTRKGMLCRVQTTEAHTHTKSRPNVRWPKIVHILYCTALALSNIPVDKGESTHIERNVTCYLFAFFSVCAPECAYASVFVCVCVEPSHALTEEEAGKISLVRLRNASELIWRWRQRRNKSEKDVVNVAHSNVLFMTHVKFDNFIIFDAVRVPL